MIRLLAVALVVAACARNNDRILEDLERNSSGRPDLDRVLDDPMRPLALEKTGGRETYAMLDDDLPFVTGVINDREIAFLLDTGSSAVSLTGPAARLTGVYVPARRDVRIVTPGNESPHRMAAFESLGLGAFRFGPGDSKAAMRWGLSLPGVTMRTSRRAGT